MENHANSGVVTIATALVVPLATGLSWLVISHPQAYGRSWFWPIGAIVIVALTCHLVWTLAISTVLDIIDHHSASAGEEEEAASIRRAALERLARRVEQLRLANGWVAVFAVVGCINILLLWSPGLLRP